MSNAALTVDAFVQALPKTETHLHIEAGLPYELLTAWQPEKYPPAPFFREAAYRFPSFPKFDEILLGHALPWFVSAERYYESARVVFAKHVVENVRYVETSFHRARSSPRSGRRCRRGWRCGSLRGCCARITPGRCGR